MSSSSSPTRSKRIVRPPFPLAKIPLSDRLRLLGGCGPDDECREQWRDHFYAEDHPETYAASYLASKLVTYILPDLRFDYLADGLVCGKRQIRQRRQYLVVTELLLEIPRDQLYEAANAAARRDLSRALNLSGLTTKQIAGDALPGEGIPLPLDEYRKRGWILRCDQAGHDAAAD